MSCMLFSDAAEFSEWEMAIHDISSHLSIENETLIHLTQTAEQYAADPENYTDGVLKQPTVYEHPGQLVGTTSALIAVHASAKKDFERDVSETEKLRNIIVESIGEHNARACAHPLTGMRRVTVQHLMTYMRDTFEKTTAETVNKLTVKLSHSMSSEDTLVVYLSKFNSICNSLQRIGHPVSDFDMVKNLEIGLRSNAAAVEAIKDYKKAHPLLSQQSFASLKAYLILHTPNNMTVTTAGYANAATASLTVKDVELLIEKAMGRASRDKQPGSANKIKTVTSKHKYCWRHGYTYHDGSECTTMKNDTTGVYTAAHLKAKTPNSPPGGNDKIY